MKIKISELTGEEQEFRWPISAKWIASMLNEDRERDELEAGLFHKNGDFHLETWLYRTEEDVFFRAQLVGKIGCTCVRCLEQFDFPIDLQFSGVYCQRPAKVEDEPDDPSHYFFEGEELDFGPAVREHVFLTLPMNPSCEDQGQTCQGEALDWAKKEAQDEEVAPIDKRWDALRQIKEKLSKN